ncbi:MAG: endonuclease III domain-containing protein [Firmicutes bacterium]|nr:endonuclease III domain-containing protein [Bacillota bacterium]
MAAELPSVAPPPAGGWGPWLGAVYRRLRERFGHRQWWPAQDGPFEVIVGAYLTQNVAWVNVEKAIANLRAAGLLTPAALHAAPVEEVAACIRPAGYYRQKAERLKIFCDYLFSRYGGSLDALFARPLGEVRAELLALKGVGPETADSILCYAGGYPVMVVDAYTRRLFYRLGAFTRTDISYDEMQAFFHRHLPADTGLFNDFHAQIVTVSNRICLKRGPRCRECPLADLCPRQGLDEGERP